MLAPKGSGSVKHSIALVDARAFVVVSLIPCRLGRDGPAADGWFTVDVTFETGRANADVAHILVAHTPLPQACF